MATLKSHAVTFVLQALRSNKTLDAGGLGVWFLAFAFGLDFTTDDEFADLYDTNTISNKLPSHVAISPIAIKEILTSSCLLNPKNLLILVALFGPNLFGSTLSVNPGNSSSPCLTTLSANTDKSIATIQPLTLFLFLSPVLLGL